MQQAAEQYLGKELANSPAFTMSGPISWKQWDERYAETGMPYKRPCIVAFFAKQLRRHHVGQYALQLFLNSVIEGTRYEANRESFFEDHVDELLDRETRAAAWWQLLRRRCIAGDPLVIYSRPNGPRLRYDSMLVHEIVDDDRRNNKRRRLADVKRVRALEPCSASDALCILEEMD
jgi:hypothetical protein